MRPAHFAERRLSSRAECGPSDVTLIINRPAGAPVRDDQFAADRPGPFRRQEYRDGGNFRGVHHAADGITARRIGREVPTFGFLGRYAQLLGAGREQPRRALGAGYARMDAVDRDAGTAPPASWSYAPGRYCVPRR